MESTSASRAVDKVFKRALKTSDSQVDDATADILKTKALAAYESAKSIGFYLGDLNGDGRIDVEDLKAAAEKAGIAWDKIDPDLKTALVAGGVAGLGINFIPFIGQMLAIPAFATTTAYFYLVAKITKIRK